MQLDFHYYATYCAAYLAGFKPADAKVIATASQFTDECTKTLLGAIGAPVAAATTQTNFELADTRTDPVGLQNITRIWSSFHFLPADLNADPGFGTKRYKNKYRLLCGPNGELVGDTLKLAHNKGLEAIGLSMHILADTWAHRYFAGTPSLVINNTNDHFFEYIVGENGEDTERRVTFRHSATASDDLEKDLYTSSMYQAGENSVMNLGHGRAGHFPDYSFAKYRYLPAWNCYNEIVKNNPEDYYKAFCQMIYAMKCLRRDEFDFAKDTYDFEAAEPYRREIEKILNKRQLIASEDWKKFGEKLSGEVICDYNRSLIIDEYKNAAPKEEQDTFIGRFTLAAMAQKSMVTAKIFNTGNLLAGFSVDFSRKGFSGIKDYMKLVEETGRSIKK